MTVIKRPLKLQMDFFNNPKIQILESGANGAQYTLLLIKMQIMSIGVNKKPLMYTNNHYHNASTLSAVTNIELSIVKQALIIFSGLDLITIALDEICVNH